jgi:cytochrome oxidase Cu insertion factor (SCO1/SenC/PrrC family)
MDHSTVIYLMEANGAFETVIPYQETDSLAVAKLKGLASTTPTS